MRVLRIVFLVLLLYGIECWPQARHHANESEPGRWEAYGGLGFTGSNPSGASFGGGFGMAGNLNRWAGVMGEFTLVQDTCCAVNTITLTDYLAGPRFAKPWSPSTRLSPFADFLFGGQTLNNSSNHHAWFYGNGSGPAIAADGGFDLRFTRRLAFRGQLGAVHSRFATSPGFGAVSNNRWRAGSYVVYRF